MTDQNDAEDCSIDIVVKDDNNKLNEDVIMGNEKRKRIESENERHTNKKQKWKNRGMNKNRGTTFKVDRGKELCPRLVDRRADSDPGCEAENCPFTHDFKKYSDNKLQSLGEDCYVFNNRGYCPRGVTCRFGSKHTTEGGLNIVNEIVHEDWKSNLRLHTTNSLKHEVQEQLRKRKYNFEKAEKIINQWSLEERALREAATINSDSKDPHTNISDLSKSHENDKLEEGVPSYAVSDIKLAVKTSNGTGERLSNIGPVLQYDTVKIRDGEKKKIDWSNKLYLSPLTTVGNLPFRRICKEFGADVTCGEMAMAANLLQGKQQEWALTKRHGSEDLFGVQICGGKTDIMTRCAQLIQEQTDVDFVDINVGCPIDLIYKQGAGSGLLNKKKVLFSIVKCMKAVLNVPLTVKTRMGVYSGKNVAHTYMANLTKAGADLITIHGRSKEQRYTKLADWEYIEQCAQLAAPSSVIGNGDILSYVDYDLAREKSPTSASVMIGRGALIKPWLFTEIKERRHWDISSQERLQMLQRFTNYGLEHWGSDTRGVESTRRFLLEWLSFLYRYVPVGLMETPPQKMNERPPKFQGRDDLEVLMASSNCTDWIKISEMLLGPVPQGFQFIPKHKANAWS